MRARAHGLSWLVEGEFRQALGELDPLSLRRPDGLPEGRLVKDSNARTVARLPWPDLE